MSNEIEIIGIVSGEPYTSTGEPTSFVIQGRAPDNIDKVKVRLLSTVSGGVLGEGETTVQEASATGDRTWSWSKQAVELGLLLYCGRQFGIETVGLDNNGNELTNTMVSTATQLVCKPLPPGTDDDGGTTDGGGNGGINWTFPWPPVPCPVAADRYVLGLVATLISFVAAFAWNSVASLAGAGVLLAAAIFYGYWWKVCAGPSLCARRTRLLWAFKWGTLGGVLIGLVALSLPALCITLGYGITCAILVLRMTDMPCPLPSMRRSYQNLPVQ